MVFYRSFSTLVLLFITVSVSHATFYPTLLQKDNCLFAYLGTSGSISALGSYRVTFLDGSEPQMKALTELTYDSKTSCAHNETNGLLILNFKQDDNFESIKLEFEIKLMPNQGVWEIVRTQFKFKATNPNLNPGDTIDLKPVSGLMYANSYQSYSCSSLVLQNLPSTQTKDGPQYKFTLRRFQLQPFANPDNRYIFAKSHDCSTWLTLPQIMGFLLIAFIIFTSLIGVYLLLELGNHTSDLKYSKQGGMLMNQAQLDATKSD